MSIYSEYIKEREGKDIIEDDRGFATYKIVDATRCYIENIYVRHEYRHSKVASDMADKITAIAKNKGCTKLLGSVCPGLMGSTASLKILLAYGFELDSIANGLILFYKGI
jgi:hypothetical protein